MWAIIDKFGYYLTPSSGVGWRAWTLVTRDARWFESQQEADGCIRGAFTAHEREDLQLAAVACVVGTV